MERKKGYFYILTNKGKNVLYVGSTKNLCERVIQHKKGYKKGFTQRYRVNELMCYEVFKSIREARDREKHVKGWTRKRKVELIKENNKEWKDLYDEIVRDPSCYSG